MADEALVDANVFMYAAGGAHEYREPCRKIVRALGRDAGMLGSWRAVVDAELFQEVAYRYASIGKPEVGRRIQESIRALALRIVSIDERVIDAFLALQEEQSASLAAGRVSVRDLLHAAAMRARGIRAIVTADRDFDRLAGIRRVDPAELSRTIGS